MTSTQTTTATFGLRDKNFSAWVERFDGTVQEAIERATTLCKTWFCRIVVWSADDKDRIAEVNKNGAYWIAESHR